MSENGVIAELGLRIVDIAWKRLNSKRDEGLAYEEYNKRGSDWVGQSMAFD